MVLWLSQSQFLYYLVILFTWTTNPKSNQVWISLLPWDTGEKSYNHVNWRLYTFPFPITAGPSTHLSLSQPTRSSNPSVISPLLYLFLSLFILRKRRGERERDRERERTSRGGAERGRQSPKQGLHWQQRAQCGAQTHKPQDHDLSLSRTLNRSTFWATQVPVPSPVS